MCYTFLENKGHKYVYILNTVQEVKPLGLESLS